MSITMTNGERIAAALERIADSLGSLERMAGAYDDLRKEPQFIDCHQVATWAESGFRERAEDATFEGLSEYAGKTDDLAGEGEFLLPDPRTFEMGDVIPEDVSRVTNSQGDLLAWRDDQAGAGFDFADDPLGIYMPRDTFLGGWVTSDFPLTEAFDVPEETRSYSLSEAAQLLAQYGIDTGQRRLKDFLNTGIAWTDHYNRPREVASGFLEVVKQESPNRDAVVRITPEGVEELARVMVGKRDAT